MKYQIDLESWKELIQKESFFPGYTFRGQSSASWDLSTNFERTICSPNNVFPANREAWILTQFKRRAHNVVKSPPEFSDNIEWLSIIQHHGGPTRLLDFTHSVFVALYFACEDFNTDGALWMVNRFKLFSLNVDWSGNKNVWDVQLEANNIAEQYIGKETKDIGVLPIEPIRLNERMSLQQGAFLMPLNIKHSFMHNLHTQLSIEESGSESIDFSELKHYVHDDTKAVDIVKIIIKASWKQKILTWLDKVNITAATLFPGLDGFAKSLCKHII